MDDSRPVTWFFALAVWIGHFYFWYSYFNAAPALPDRASGHLIALNNHGSVHYIRASEDQKITPMRVVAALLFAACFLVYARLVGPRQPWESR